MIHWCATETLRSKEPGMAHILTLQLPDEDFEPIVRAAATAGQTPEEWARARLRAAAPSSAERSAALARLMVHAGAASLGTATGADNESIDADLAREYASTHEADG
jgi:hypothetical protein